MNGGFVLLANFVCAAALLAAAPALWRGVFVSPRALPLAVVPLGLAVLLTVYVFGEDDYRGNGISRWDAYRSPGGALGPMFVLSLALLGACAMLIVVGARRGSASLVGGAALGGGIASLVLVTPTIVGFTAN